MTDGFEPTPHRRKKGSEKKNYTLQFRCRDHEDPPEFFRALGFHKWKPYKKYKSKKAREQALEDLNRSDRYFEYRRGEVK